ncbi:MAG: hypothetical protein J6Y71_05020 [Ruminococcus sp.]|nr:hypothetical protein [Ruminococcus sp.]
MKIKALAMAALLAVSVVSATSCGDGTKPSGTYVNNFYTNRKGSHLYGKHTIYIYGKKADLTKVWFAADHPCVDGTAELDDWSEYNNGMWYYKADFTVYEDLDGDGESDGYFYKAGFSNKKGTKVSVGGYTYSK